ncbi:MAG: hypothetical protein F7C82_03050 [Desulfurococcales archaeon]|nr:hypothetical protein [Desulfurococcales archaeon]MCE4622450.1 hypothetical protein [Desulfurococcales archaeon]MCE4627399.1 hypothetical protein [Desulfurococcales archaeon]MCE4629234.1 hypothetical protein [Desulfurococcales archaeon]
MPESIIIVKGARIILHYPIILARSKNFAITMVSKNIEEAIPGNVKELVAKALEEGHIPSGDNVEENIMARTILYGGILLFYTSGNDAIPLSRLILSSGGYKIIAPCNQPIEIKDEDLLSMWKALYKNRPREALTYIKECTFSPSFKIAYEPGEEILPVGYETVI